MSGDPFQFVNTTTGESITDLPVIDDSSGQTVVQFTFAPGPSVNSGGGLLDGDYELVIASDLVSIQTVNLDGNGDGTEGGDYIFGAAASDEFFRRHGDQNGNGTVDLLDFAQFRETFGQTSADAGFLASFDVDADNIISLLDFSRFRQNFGT